MEKKILAFGPLVRPHPFPCSSSSSFLLPTMVPAVLNLYVGKPFVQLIGHCHSTKQTQGKNRSIDCTCLQRIDFSFLYLVEWKCWINCIKGLATYRFKTADTLTPPRMRPVESRGQAQTPPPEGGDEERGASTTPEPRWGPRRLR